MINFKIKSIVFLYILYSQHRSFVFRIIFFLWKNLFAILNITKIKILWNILEQPRTKVFTLILFILPSIARETFLQIFSWIYTDSSAKEEDESSSSHTLGVYANSLALSHFVHIRCMYVNIVTWTISKCFDLLTLQATVYD